MKRIGNMIYKNEFEKSIPMRWKEEIIYKLNNKENEKIDIFLIEKDLIDKKTNLFFNYHVKENEILRFLKNENINNNKINKEINENSKFYILNEKSWNYLFGNKYNELKIIYEGYFLNKILLFTKEQNYFFLFLNENKEIKKGFFKVNIEINNIKNIIINYFKENEPLKKVELFNKYSIKYKILDDNSIFEDKKEKEEIILCRNIGMGKLNIKPNSFNESRKNEINRNTLFDLKTVNFLKNGNEVKIFQNKNILDENKFFRRDFNISPNFAKEEQNNELKNIINQKTSILPKPKENIDLINIRNTFAQKTQIKKRNASIQNKNKNFELNLDDFLPKKVIYRPSIPGVIGLSKISDIPFINPIIQCFSNVQRLKFELLSMYNDLKNNKSSEKKLSFALAKVLKNLWENLNIREYKPKTFIEIIKSNINQTIKEPKQLIDYLLKEIHYELNNVENMNIVMNQNMNLFQNNNFIEVFDIYKKNYENRNNSIISKEFSGYFTEVQRCTNCNFYFINSKNIQHFNFLNFNLDIIIKFKNYNFNCIDICECFEYFQKKENIFLNCNICGAQMYKFTKILNMPNTLIINFDYNGTKVRINYKEYLNLKKNILFNNDIFYYELIGVITYINNENENNFVAYCKNDKCIWYKYNDNKVTKSSFREIDGIPFVLFYSYIQI